MITLLDTPGAYPGIDAEERGQAQAIAENLREMSRLAVPVITVVIGEGGSGGALGLGVGNRVYMLENAVYSVISPESCAAIIYRDSGRAPAAATPSAVSMICFSVSTEQGPAITTNSSRPISTPLMRIAVCSFLNSLLTNL